MALVLAGLFCGFIFGCGLLISGMVQPAKVLAFLDIAGEWDPSLAFTMAAALALSGVGFVLARRREMPMLAAKNLWPTRADIDRPLLLGAVLFGIGWGLCGLCPGPALENLASLSPKIIAFVVAMAVGMTAHDAWQRGHLTPAPNEGEPVPATDG
jgi:uncharacterized protein